MSELPRQRVRGRNKKAEGREHIGIHNKKPEKPPSVPKEDPEDTACIKAKKTALRRGQQYH